MKSEKSQKPSKHHKKKGSKEKKKSKKKNAKKHHRHQEERKLSADNSTYFSSLLSSGILSFPSLFEDFPAMISTMDSGQSVNISKISDKKKASILNKLFSYLPLINDPNYGWCYNNPNGEKISSIILKKLLEEKAIKQPKELNQGEVLASQKAPLALLELFTNFPELLSEMPILLSNLLDGKAVDVEDIENEDVRDGLEKLFKSLDLAIDSGYVLPYDSRRSAAFEALGSLKDMIVSHERFSSDMEVEDGLGNASGSDDSSKSNDNDDDDDDDGEGSGDCNPRGREESEDFQLPQRKFDMVVTEQQVVYKGPAMPTREQLALAQSHLLHNPQSFIEEEEEEDEEEEGVGPRLYNPAKDASLVLRQSLQKALPLGFTGVELESAIETITSAATMQSSKSFPAESNEEPKEINEREEWILTPGNSKLISELDSSVNKNRKFQTGKHAKQQVAELNRRQQNLPPSVATGEADSIMAEYREKRGPSLMDAHAEKKAKGPSGKERGRIAFDRDMEFLSHRSMDSMQVQQLVEKAKEMDSRFDRGSVQKSFL